MADQANEAKKYRGVSRNGNKFGARVKEPSRVERTWIGSFTTAEEAAKAYDRFAAKAFGRKAKLNFPPPPSPPTSPNSKTSHQQEGSFSTQGHQSVGNVRLTTNGKCSSAESSIKACVPSSRRSHRKRRSYPLVVSKEGQSKKMSSTEVKKQENTPSTLPSRKPLPFDLNLPPPKED